MRRKGYQLTRYADDWVITCKSAQEAHAALADALRILERLGVQLNPEKTRIVHVRFGFDFLGIRSSAGSPDSWATVSWVGGPRRERCRRTRGRRRSVVSRIRCASLPAVARR
jgi:hypothetical protein